MQNSAEQDAQAPNARVLPPLSKYALTSSPATLVQFLLDHQITPRKNGGDGVGHNFDYVDSSGSYHILAVPEDRIDVLYDLLSNQTDERVDLSEKLDQKNFKMAFDLDWKMDKLQKTFKLKYQAAVDFFHSQRDKFLIAVQTTFHEINNENQLDTTPIILSRSCHNYHIVYPHIRTNSPTMKQFVTKILKHLPQTEDDDANDIVGPNGKKPDPLFKWKDVIDIQPYTGSLRMAGCVKHVANNTFSEVGWHMSFFGNYDQYSTWYSEDQTDRKVDALFLSQCSLHCYNPGEETPNFELMTVNEFNNASGDLIQDLFFNHTDKVVRRRVRQGIFNLNTTELMSNGTSVQVSSQVTSWKKMNERSVEKKPCYIAQLVEQECPFLGRYHTRASPTLYCVVFEESMSLNCHDCSKLDLKAKCYTHLDLDPSEVDYLLQQELAASALISRSHEALASVIFNWIKDRVAASESLGKTGRPSYNWYYFEQEVHVWVRGDKRVVDDIMGIGGLIQSKFTEVQKKLTATYKESGADNAGHKKKALTDCINKLFKLLQSTSVLTTVVPLIGRKVASYYQSRDRHRRCFEEQLDDQPWLLATLSGVIDFRKKILRDGVPNDFLSVNINNPYTPWEKLDAVNRQEVVNYFIELFPVQDERDRALWVFARGLNGELRRQCMYFCLGKGGDGKSVLFGKVFKKMLGTLCRDGQPATITGQDQDNGSGPRADLIHMKRCRYFCFTEANEKDPLNLGRFKQLTGGEVVSAAAKFGDQEEIQLQTIFFVIGNYKMRIEAPASDDGTWRRVEYLFFRRRYRRSQAEFTGEEYESWALPDDKITQLVERLSLSSLSYLVHIYDQTSHISDWPEPVQLRRLRDETREENDIWLKYINETTRESEPGEKGLTVNQFWEPFISWLKSRNNIKRASTIEKFQEYMTTHLREPVILDPKYPNEKGWKREFITDPHSIETADMSTVSKK